MCFLQPATDVFIGEIGHFKAEVVLLCTSARIHEGLPSRGKGQRGATKDNTFSEELLWEDRWKTHEFNFQDFVPHCHSISVLTKYHWQYFSVKLHLIEVLRAEIKDRLMFG